MIWFRLMVVIEMVVMGVMEVMVVMVVMVVMEVMVVMVMDSRPPLPISGDSRCLTD
jgi:hypothetical protein